MNAKVNVTGEDQAATTFSRMAARVANLSAPLEPQARRAAQSVSGIPRRTGNLADSVRDGYKVEPDGFTVATDVWYAHFVFGGTSKQPAREPRIPAGQIGRSTALAVGNWAVR